MSGDADAHAARLATLRALGELQGIMSVKARFYKDREPELAGRFARASLAAINARMLIQAALMSERETAL